MTQTCKMCRGTGQADPFEVHGGSPPFVWCDECLGAGIEDCATCEGYGAVPAPADCPDCDVGVREVPAAAA